MAVELKLFCVVFDGQQDYVEAPSMSAAIAVWHEHMKIENGADWIGDEEPESCSLIHSGPVRRQVEAGEPRAHVADDELLAALQLIAHADEDDMVHESWKDVASRCVAIAAEALAKAEAA